jgi:hypothetical protein
VDCFDAGWDPCKPCAALYTLSPALYLTAAEAAPAVCGRVGQGVYWREGVGSSVVWWLAREFARR